VPCCLQVLKLETIKIVGGRKRSRRSPCSLYLVVYLLYLALY